MRKKSSLKRLQIKTRRPTDVSPRASGKHSAQRKVWLRPEHGISRFQVKRRFAIGLTFVTVLAFIYFITSERDFFDVRAKNVSVLGDHSNASNGSEGKPNRNDGENTKEKPWALLKYNMNHEVRFLQVDVDGYVMRFIDSPKAANSSVTIVAHTQGQLPEPDTYIYSEHVQLALRVLRTVLNLTPEIAARIRTIDANNPEKITLQLDGGLPVVWLSSDLVETGLNNIDLFLKNRTEVVKQKNRNRRKAYLDARFADAIYLGRIT